MCGRRPRPCGPRTRRSWSCIHRRRSRRRCGLPLARPTRARSARQGGRGSWRWRRSARARSRPYSGWRPVPRSGGAQGRHPRQGPHATGRAVPPRGRRDRAPADGQRGPRARPPPDRIPGGGPAPRRDRLDRRAGDGHQAPPGHRPVRGAAHRRCGRAPAGGVRARRRTGFRAVLPGRGGPAVRGRDRRGRDPPRGCGRPARSAGRDGPVERRAEKERPR